MQLQYVFKQILVLSLFFFSQVIFAQTTTIVKGHIIDDKTKEDMLYVNVQFDNSSSGTTSDIDGKFYMETTDKVDKLKVSYIGYKTQYIEIKPGQVNNITVSLIDEAIGLDEVVVKVEKYKNKDNPAVALIKKVIENKEKNRKENFDYYSYNKHEKMEFALNNITNKTRNGFLFKRIKFIFENADTNKVTGKVNLPIFLRENISDVYFRKDPKSKKEYIRAEKITNIDDQYVPRYRLL